MSHQATISRRAVLRAFGAAGASAAAWPALSHAAEADEGAAFDAAVARQPLLAPFKGIGDAGPTGGEGFALPAGICNLM